MIGYPGVHIHKTNLLTFKIVIIVITTLQLRLDCFYFTSKKNQKSMGWKHITSTLKSVLTHYTPVYLSCVQVCSGKIWQLLPTSCGLPEESTPILLLPPPTASKALLGNEWFTHLCEPFMRGSVLWKPAAVILQNQSFKASRTQDSGYCHRGCSCLLLSRKRKSFEKRKNKTKQKGNRTATSRLTKPAWRP